MERRVIVEMNNQPLVSVPVITYNSAKFVLETLESIKAQTYQNIELIISDDCSTDNTVELCQKWVEENKERFVRTHIITSETNTGVSANLNRAEVKCHGDWIKGIAGDDILMPTCVEEFIKYVSIHPNIQCVFCKMEGFGRSQEEVNEYMNRCFDYSFFTLTVAQQYHRLIFNGNCVPAPTLFYSKELVTSNRLSNDERIPMVEDYPKWMNLTKSGVQLQLLDKMLVRYRLSENSISTTSTPSLKVNQSNSLIYIYYLFLPRFNYYKSPIKRIGEIRKYIYAANTSWGGFFWRFLVGIDTIFARCLNLLGCNIKI